MLQTLPRSQDAYVRVIAYLQVEHHKTDSMNKTIFGQHYNDLVFMYPPAYIGTISEPKLFTFLNFVYIMLIIGSIVAGSIVIFGMVRYCRRMYWVYNSAD